MSMPCDRIELAPGYTVSRLVKGGWHLAGGHGPVDRAQAIQDMAEFVLAGITTFDCADHYTGVEELIGDFRAAHPELGRQVQIHTKCVPDYDRMTSCDATYLQSIIDRSLMRLRTDCLDLVQFHWWNYSVPGYVEAMQALDRLRQAGKIRFLGLNNSNVARTRELLDAGIPLLSTQVQYSCIDTRPEKGLVELCQQRGVHLLCYGSLAGGFMARSWLNQPEPFEPLGNRSLTKYKLIIEDAGGWTWFQNLLALLDDIAREHDVDLPQVATRWVLDQTQAACAIVGATSSRHLQANLRASGLVLTADDHARIRALMDSREPVPGDVYDLERDKTGRHGRIMRYNLNEGRH
jgi:aryl-alcohol dehydrogenase-like predicted oxidoreductase